MVQPILESWERHEGGVESYAAGSEGPAGADALVQHDGRSWLALPS